ncbi:MAG: bifunctional diaminohydroxyphosphoribosylaminopyrimidine deaminase/5-amino-6-(5-phosphoribosylamino)uracil reductase RibD [bacterium]
MRRALALAATPGVPPGPNPRVGCVILDAAGRTLAEGWHRGAGTPHAEVDALARVAGSPRGAIAVVTLEPCDHVGRTGPCSQALAEAGVARVVFAQQDPHALAAGGAARLRAAGVDVEGGVLADEASALNEAWAFAVTRGRPLVTWRVDAIAVGTGTVLVDDPHLAARDDAGGLRDRQPLRVVIGLRDIPPGSRVLDGSAPTVHLRTRDPAEALAELQAREVRHLLLEGGPALAAAFLAAGVVDRVVWYVAPAILGSGRPAVADLGVGTISEAIRLAEVRVDQVGADARITGRLPRG